MYSLATLKRYVEADLSVIEAVAPDVVIGDFRLSLPVSARLAGTPYLAITNAYWSPYARPRFPVPNLPTTRLLGVRFSQGVFDRIRPLVFSHHARAHDQLRQAYGLRSLGHDMRCYYSDGDYTLYPDIPELIPTYDRPESHVYLGHVPWQPQLALPEWWSELPKDRPIIYINLGSSGVSSLLPMVLNGLDGLDLCLIVATAGRTDLDASAIDAHVADFLPGDRAAARADLVICNGGSPSTLQALAAGTAVIGLPSNFDQFINMTYLEQAGAGVLLRPDRAKPRDVAAAVQGVLVDRRSKARAGKIKRRLASYRPGEVLSRLLTTLA